MSLGVYGRSFGVFGRSLGGLWGSLGGLWEVSGGSLGAQVGQVSCARLFWISFKDVLVSFLEVLEGLEKALKDKVTEKSPRVNSRFRCRILIEIRDVRGRPERSVKVFERL